MMQSVEVKGLDSLCRSLEGALREMPEKRRAAHERLGAALEKQVRGEVRGRLKQHTGKVCGWQEKRIGSGGGYAAVSAAGDPNGRNGAGAVTNYLENGHAKRRSATGRRGMRRHLARMLYYSATENWVSGRYFYRASREAAPQLLQQEAETLARELAGRLDANGG